MPTGYTYKVQKGEVTDLRTFAMDCARAFGACVTLRDDPSAPIPEVFEPSDFYVQEIAKRREKVARVYSMTPEEAVIACEAEFEEASAEHERLLADKATERQRYKTMMDAVLAWEPPTPDHVGLRSFMLEQLRTSIDFDCSTEYYREPERLTPEAWLSKVRAEADKDLAYATEKHAEEVKRAADRTTWVAALRRSLPPNEAAAERESA